MSRSAVSFWSFNRYRIQPKSVDDIQEARLIPEISETIFHEGERNMHLMRLPCKFQPLERTIFLVETRVHNRDLKSAVANPEIHLLQLLRYCSGTLGLSAARKQVPVGGKRATIEWIDGEHMLILREGGCYIAHHFLGRPEYDLSPEEIAFELEG